MASRKFKLTSRRQRRAAILLILGVIGGHVICLVISSLLRVGGQRSPCSLTDNEEEGAEGLKGGIPSLEVKGDHLGADDVTVTKELLFVGVMTSRRYLRTRARAIHRTWGSTLNGSLFFFVGGGEGVNGMEEEDKEEDKEDEEEEGRVPLPVHVLQHIRDSEYPPQRKSFAMLEFMHKNYGQRYEWFMRADDDLFVDVSRMRTLLTSLNSSRPLYLGHPGTGKPEEVGQLGLPNGVTYCMGGTGVVLSSTVLTSLVGEMMTCTQNTVTQHEDSELGRCVFNASGLSCLQSGKIYHKFKQNYDDDTSGAWVRKALRSPQSYVTFHPVKDARYMYDSAAQRNVQRITELQAKVRQFTAMISCMDVFLNETESSQEVTSCDNGTCFRVERNIMCESSAKNVRDKLFDRVSNIPWFLIHKNTFYTLWKFELTKPANFGGVWDGMTKVLRHLSAHVRANDGRGAKKSKNTVLGNFYKRVVPGAGMEYVAFVRDTSSVVRGSSSSSLVRPYVIRRYFDDLVLVQKQ